ncbi:MAG: thiol peroxidase [Candidatus Omnitrophota bacterium]
MPRKITFKGDPLTLVGRRVKTGMPAPDFKVVSPDLKEVRLSDFSGSGNKSESSMPLSEGKGKIKLIIFFPSLDTPVCDLQVKEFNKRAVGFSSDVVVLGISKDLPFAQKRFCQENDIKNVLTLSDYKSSSFGINYGVLVKEINLLARGVVIIDKNDIIRYFRTVEELTTPPDYEDALNNLAETIKDPSLTVKEELPSQCKPCAGAVASLPRDTVERLLAKYRGWEVIEDKKLVKELKFRDFQEAKYFLDLVSFIAQEQGHHPVLTLNYNKLKITLTTHAAGGLTENDFIMAGIIDELGAEDGR